jgi:hypothetical protein
MRLTETEKKEILSKYSGDTSNELLTHLKRHFPVYETNSLFLEKPLKFIKLADKVKYLENNKKYLVNLISEIVEESWIHLGIPKIRKTVKKYLDVLK